MALYANENGTLQQLSDKSSGSNPYAQLEVAYSRNFIDDPLTFDNVMNKIEHIVLTNKPIGEYHLLLAVEGGYGVSPTQSQFTSPTIKCLSIPSFYKYSSLGYMSIGLSGNYSIKWYPPTDKTSNVLKYMYAYATGGTLSNTIWDFYLI